MVKQKKPVSTSTGLTQLNKKCPHEYRQILATPTCGQIVHAWCELVLKFGKLFKRAAGDRDSMDQEARRRGQDWMHAPGSTVMTGAT